MIISKSQVFTGNIKECTVYDPILYMEKGIAYTRSGKEINPQQLIRVADCYIFDSCYIETKTIERQIPLIKIQDEQEHYSFPDSESAYVGLFDYDLFLDFYLKHMQDIRHPLTSCSRPRFPYKRVIFSKPCGFEDIFVNERSLFSCFQDRGDISIKELKRAIR